MFKKLYDPIFNEKRESSIALRKREIKEEEGITEKAVCGSFNCKHPIPVLVDIKNRICVPELKNE